MFNPSPKKPETHRLLRRVAKGQALVEYALITALLVIAIIAALMATGPAVGNVFSNTVFNLIGAAEPSATPLNPTEFWDLVTAVASYIPPTVVQPTNTLAPPTNTPTQGPSPTHTPITPTATPTVTETPGPSPTPEDIIHPAPFYSNVSNEDWWRLDTDAVFTGTDPWDVEWFATGTRNTSAVDSVMSGAPTCTSTEATPDIENFWGSSSGPTPGVTGCSGDPWRTDDFASRWTRTVRFENDTTLRLTTISDDGIRVYIDGSEVNEISDWSYHGNRTYTVDYTFTGGTDHTVVVEHFEGGWGATMVFTMTGASEDEGTCNWSMSDESYHSDPYAWSDSPGVYYSDNSLCHIALRGAVDLSTLGSDPPFMTFWNRWDLDDYDKAWVQIREYGDTGPWYAKLIHENYEEQLSWWREEVDLADFDGINVDTAAPVTGMDWSGKTIEFRFVLEADSSATESGWWIDDIAIEANIITYYTIGWADDMESAFDNWLPGGSWAITDERTRSGSGAWSDSPGGNYVDWTNAILQLNGLVDLTGPEAIDPELVFYHSWYLGNNDTIWVEASLDGENWTSLTPEALEEYTRNDVYVRETISLADYMTAPFYLRFRLEADNYYERDGWYIDDIALQNHPSGNLPYPFFDNMENGGANWIPEGTWAISPEQSYSGASAWSDSPDNNYADDSNASLTTAAPFLLSPTGATPAVHPELSFWYRRYLGRYDDLYVEVSQDDGDTWTQVWSFEYYDISTPHPEAPPDPSDSGGVPYYEFNEQKGWERVSINLQDYISETTPILIRFRLDALSNNETRDGVWIDDIRLEEYTETPHTLPFYDDMEGAVNWYPGGTWALSDEDAHSGNFAWSDSPGENINYIDDSWSVLELIEPVDLTGLAVDDFPVLYWWDHYDLDRYDYARVQISSWLGSTADDWDNWSDWEELYPAQQQHYYERTDSWNRHVVDLRPYIGEKIRVRFVLDALQHGSTDPGWWVDDVAIELYDPTVYPLAFTDSAETLNHWIAEGTWGLGDIFRGTGSDPAALGPGLWAAEFYDIREYGYCGGDSWVAQEALEGDSIWCGGSQVTFSPVLTADVADIDYECDSNSSPGPYGSCTTTAWASSHDHYAIRFVRTIDVEAGEYEFRVTHDDGARLFVDGTRVMSKWYDTGPRTDSTSLSLTAGEHVVEVWFYENSGGTTMQLEVARKNFSFHDSPDGNYDHMANMSLMLDGVIDLTGSTNPALSWYDTYDVDYIDCMLIEVTMPFVSGQFGNWVPLYEECYDRNDTWTQHDVPLRPALENELGLEAGTLDFNGLQIGLRFRLDARVGSSTDPGWWIDDILLAD